MNSLTKKLIHAVSKHMQKHRAPLCHPHLWIFFWLVSSSINLNAQDTVRYTGSTLVNVDYHHGELTPAVGVHNIQVFRANREDTEAAGGNNGCLLNATFKFRSGLVLSLSTST